VDSELEVIRDQMEETRASLADKLETLEAQVRETVQTATDTVASATETVTSTVENVKQAVSSTVENVKETVDSVASRVDPRPYFQEHPWTAFGASVGVGFLGGLLLGGSSSPAPQTSWTASAPPSPTPPGPARQQQSSGLFDTHGVIGEALNGLKGLAVGTLMGYLREMVSTSVPEMWKNDLTGLLDNITGQLGGKVIHHPDLTRRPFAEQGNGTHCPQGSDRSPRQDASHADM